MKKWPIKLLAILMTAFAMGTIAGEGPAVFAANTSSDQFVGTWNLVSFYTYPADGEPVDRNMTGQIHYDTAGNMAAQLMPSGETDERVTPGYVAYFGTYAVDAEAGTVTHSVAGSNFSRWVNTDLVRHFEFSEGQLALSLKEDGRVTGTLHWARAE